MAHCAGLDVVLDPADIASRSWASRRDSAASVYAASEGLETIAFGANAAGGQAARELADRNYLGFPPNLGRRAYEECAAAGTSSALACRSRTSLGCAWGGQRVLVLENGAEVRAVRARSDGSNMAGWKSLGSPSSKGGDLLRRNWMEASMCRDQEIVVVGAGNSAGQAIVFLSHRETRQRRVARRRPRQSMSRYLVDRVECLPNVVVVQ